jgi:adenylate cyclase 10
VIDDFQPLEYLSEMRQVSIVFINLVLDEDEDETRLLQKIFEVIHTQTKAMHGKLYIVINPDKGQGDARQLALSPLPGPRSAYISFLQAEI